MNLLKEGTEQQAVVKTTLTRKLTVDGLTKAYPVYKVRLDCLFYNDQNDRIATWISQYKAQNEGKAPDSTDRENYNNIIEQFIVESNSDAIRKTQNNIEMVDQREPGVVLADTPIIWFIYCNPRIVFIDWAYQMLNIHSIFIISYPIKQKMALGL